MPYKIIVISCVFHSIMSYNNYFNVSSFSNIMKHYFIFFLVLFVLWHVCKADKAIDITHNRPEYIKGSFTVIFEENTEPKHVNSQFNHIKKVHASSVHEDKNGVVSKKFSRAFQVSDF